MKKLGFILCLALFYPFVAPRLSYVCRRVRKRLRRIYHTAFVRFLFLVQIHGQSELQDLISSQNLPVSNRRNFCRLFVRSVFNTPADGKN